MSATADCDVPTGGSSSTPQWAYRKLSGMTNTTFQERLALAMEGLPRGGKSALARACGISPTSVNDWATGKTKMPTADLIFPAARFLGVLPEWLATGRGPIHPREDGVKNSQDGSQSMRLDVETLAKALRFTKLWLNITGDKTPIERHAALVLTAAETIGTLEANIESDDELSQVMARLKAMGGTNGVERGTTGGIDSGAA